MKKNFLGDVVNHGKILLWNCPNCEGERAYDMVEFKAGKSKSMIYLDCPDCKYDVRIDPKEYGFMREVRELYRQLSSKEITREAYDTSLQEIDSSFMHELTALTQDWTCACGESNSVSFLECWNCQTDNPNVEINIQEAEELGEGQAPNAPSSDGSPLI